MFCFWPYVLMIHGAFFCKKIKYILHNCKEVLYLNHQKQTKMNSRRFINNVLPKVGFSNMYELIYTHNCDSRNNNSCSTHTESFLVSGESIVFESNDTLKKVCKILDVSKECLIKELKRRL